MNLSAILICILYCQSAKTLHLPGMWFQVFRKIVSPKIMQQTLSSENLTLKSEFYISLKRYWHLTWLGYFFWFKVCSNLLWHQRLRLRQSFHLASVGSRILRSQQHMVFSAYGDQEKQWLQTWKIWPKGETWWQSSDVDTRWALLGLYVQQMLNKDACRHRQKLVCVT